VKKKCCNVSSMQSFRVPDVHVYEARSNYYAGEILEGVSGASLYLKTDPWGITIHCDEEGMLHSVEFENGRIWSFSTLSDRIKQMEWPLFVRDLPQHGCCARVRNIFSDSMNLTLTSENALLDDMLIWHYPPSPRGNAALSVRGVHTSMRLPVR
jgi:hypothetical protein